MPNKSKNIDNNYDVYPCMVYELTYSLHSMTLIVAIWRILSWVTTEGDHLHLRFDATVATAWCQKLWIYCLIDWDCIPQCHRDRYIFYYMLYTVRLCYHCSRKPSATLFTVFYIYNYQAYILHIFMRPMPTIQYGWVVPSDSVRATALHRMAVKAAFVTIWIIIYTNTAH